MAATGSSSGLRSVFIAVYANLLTAALLFGIGRLPGGTPHVFTAIYLVISLCSVVGVVALNRPTPGAFRLGFAVLALNAILHFALYVLNDQLESAGRVPVSNLGYLFGATFTVAITSLGFLCRPENQRRSGFGPIDAMDES